MLLSSLLKQLLRKGYKIKHFKIESENFKIYMIEPELEFEKTEIVIQSPHTLVLLRDTDTFYENILSDFARKIRLSDNIVIVLSKEG